MGMLNDFIIAPETDAQAIVKEWPATKRWPHLDSRQGIGVFALGALSSALGDDELAASLMEGGKLGASAGESGPWVLILPLALRDRLAALDEAQTPDLAARWTAHEDMGASEDEAPDLTDLLRELRTFSLLAVKEQKPLMLWVSL